MFGSTVVVLVVVVCPIIWADSGMAIEASSATLSAASEIAGPRESTPRRRTELDIGGISFGGMNSEKGIGAGML